MMGARLCLKQKIGWVNKIRNVWKETTSVVIVKRKRKQGQWNTVWRGTFIGQGVGTHWPAKGDRVTKRSVVWKWELDMRPALAQKLQVVLKEHCMESDFGTDPCPFVPRLEWDLESGTHHPLYMSSSPSLLSIKRMPSASGEKIWIDHRQKVCSSWGLMAGAFSDSVEWLNSQLYSHSLNAVSGNSTVG